MKSNVIWTIIGIIVLIAIVYSVYKYVQKLNPHTGIVLTQPTRREVVPVSTTRCPTGQVKCSQTGGGGTWAPDKNGTECCIITGSGRVVPTSKTPEQEYCERHGGTWNGTSCTAFTDINRIAYNPNINYGGPRTNPINPAL